MEDASQNTIGPEDATKSEEEKKNIHRIEADSEGYVWMALPPSSSNNVSG